MDKPPFNLNLDVDHAVSILCGGGDLSEQVNVASDIMLMVEYYGTSTRRGHLRLAGKHRNAFMTSSWQIQDSKEYLDFAPFAVTVGSSFSKVAICVMDASQPHKRGYHSYAHIGTGTYKQRGFYPDIVYSLASSILPEEWRTCVLVINEGRDAQVAIKVYDSTLSTLINSHAMWCESDGRVQSTFSHVRHIGFFFAVYKVYMGISIQDSPVRFPSSVMRTECWSCGCLDVCQLCSGCYNARYCSKECQRDQWPHHKRCCNKSMTLYMRFVTSE